MRWAQAHNTLEVGMANGMSTLFIAQGVKDNGGGTHTCIDPFQSTQWANTARNSVKRAGMQDMVRRPHVCLSGCAVA